MNSRVVAGFVACSAALASAGWFADFTPSPDSDDGYSQDPIAYSQGGNPDVVVWDLQSFANYSPQNG